MMRLATSLGLLLILAVSGVLADESGVEDVVFLNCPPVVSGYRCDSLSYQAIAVNDSADEAGSQLRYVLVHGPGDINELTGLWVYHPVPGDDGANYEVEIGAEADGHSTTSDQNCRFVACIRSHVPTMSVAPGNHFSVLPTDSVLVPLEPYDADSCDAVSVTWQVTPEPDGIMAYDEPTTVFRFKPGQSDSGKTFTVAIQVGGEEVGNLYFDVFTPDPIVVRLETVPEAFPGDTVEVDVVLERCPVEFGHMHLAVAFDHRLVRPGAGGGEALFSATEGCGWQLFHIYTGSSCADDYGMMEVLMFADGTGLDPLPTCFVPDSLPAVIATLRFEVWDVPGVTAGFAPVMFYWCNCHDNTLFSPDYEYEYSSSVVYDHEGQPVVSDGLRGPSGVTTECRPDAEDGQRIRRVEFHNGGVQINLPPPPIEYDVRIANVRRHRLGQEAIVDVTFGWQENISNPGGFDLLVAHDPSALSFMTAEPGRIPRECGWEYFTYNQVTIDDCDSCPTGLVRIVGIAETDDGPPHPDPDCDIWPEALASLHFLITSDTTYGGRFYPVRFFWNDCGDNVLTDALGTQTFVSDRVFDLVARYTQVNDGTVGLPTFLGAQDSCLSIPAQGGALPIRATNFYNGGIEILCVADTIDAVGDIDLDGYPFSMGDLTEFIWYLNYGCSEIEPACAKKAVTGDLNGDGMALHIADLLNLLNVAYRSLPVDSLVDTAAGCVVHVTQDTHNRTIALDIPEEIVNGAFHLAFDGELTPVQTGGIDLGAHLTCNISADTTRLWAGDGVFGGTVQFTYTGDGTLYEAQAAYGRPALLVPTEIHYVTDTPDELPTQFTLDQNYPNPFNPATTITYALPVACQMSLDVYNVMGQKVRTLIDATMPAGYHQVLWNGNNGAGESVASGVYFYRISAGDFVQCRKMLLLK